MTKIPTSEYAARRERVMEYITRPGVKPFPWSKDYIESIAIACDCSFGYLNNLHWRLTHPERVQELYLRSNARRKARDKRKRLKAKRAQELATAAAHAPAQQLELNLNPPPQLMTLQEYIDKQSPEEKAHILAVREEMFPQMLPPPPPVIHVDMVNSPPHYTAGGIETIDYIRAKLSHDEYIGYLRGNIIKYSSRLGMKDSMAQDSGKLAWYSQELTKYLAGGN